MSEIRVLRLSVPLILLRIIETNFHLCFGGIQSLNFQLFKNDSCNKQHQFCVII